MNSLYLDSCSLLLSLFLFSSGSDFSVSLDLVTWSKVTERNSAGCEGHLAERSAGRLVEGFWGSV